MDKEKVNPNFDISAKCKDMITTSEMIVDRYQFIIDRGYEPSIYMSLAYDVKNYLPKLLKENQKQKEIIDVLDFIKARAIAGATQETINKLAINFVNSYIKEGE